MPTANFEVADYDVAVEPWSPIKRRITLRSSADGDGERDEATLLFTSNRTETGVVSDVDGPGGVSVWAYFDLEDFDDVRRLLESESVPHLHYGHVSGTGSTRSLYFVSVETTASVPGRGDAVEESLPFGAYDEDADESLEFAVDSEAVERVHDRTGEKN